MKRLSIFFAATLFLTREASAACLDDLRRLADEHLAFNEAVDVNYKEQRSSEGGVFIVYFDKQDASFTEHAVPNPNNNDTGGNVLAIRAGTYGETGQGQDRISFLNKRDFVIRTIHLMYESQITFPRGSEVLKAESADYFFCANALQIPKDVAGGERETRYKKDAEEARTFFFSASELAPYLKRLKQ